jgi:hypothetical protein
MRKLKFKTAESVSFVEKYLLELGFEVESKGNNKIIIKNNDEMDIKALLDYTHVKYEIIEE